MFIDGVAETVDNAAKPRGGRVDLGPFGGDADFGAGGDAFDRAERHHQGAVLAETDDLDRQGHIVTADNLATRPDLHVGEAATRFDQQAIDHRHASVNAQGIDILHHLDKVLHGGDYGK